MTHERIFVLVMSLYLWHVKSICIPVVKLYLKPVKYIFISVIRLFLWNVKSIFILVINPCFSYYRYFVEEDGKPTLQSLYEEWFHCVDLGTQLGPVIKRYWARGSCFSTYYIND